MNKRVKCYLIMLFVLSLWLIYSIVTAISHSGMSERSIVEDDKNTFYAETECNKETETEKLKTPLTTANNSIHKTTIKTCGQYKETNAVKLTWSKVSGTKYVVYRKVTETKKWVRIKKTNCTYYVDKTTKYGKRYTYKVYVYKTDKVTGKTVTSKRSNYMVVRVKYPEKEQPTYNEAQTKQSQYSSSVSYSEYDLYLMSHLINGEAGCSWCSDEEQRAVGSVVLNRMKDSRFPSTMEGVIFQQGQYACTWDGNFDVAPSERVIENAKYILTYGSTLPIGVVFQAQSIQGSIYAKIGVHYFCY